MGTAIPYPSRLGTAPSARAFSYASCSLRHSGNHNLAYGLDSQGGFPVTRIRKIMLEELQRRNYSTETIRAYIICRVLQSLSREPRSGAPSSVSVAQDRAKAGCSHDQGAVIGAAFSLCANAPATLHVGAHSHPQKTPVKLPKILSREEITRLIESANNLMHRAILMTVYSTGMRRSEVCSSKVSDIDGACNVANPMDDMQMSGPETARRNPTRKRR